MFCVNQCCLFVELVQKLIFDQIKFIIEKWDFLNFNCVFCIYFYNKVEEYVVLYYYFGFQDDFKEWDEVFCNKFVVNFMFVFCVGFLVIVVCLML